jgi:hypothetical protein
MPLPEITPSVLTQLYTADESYERFARTSEDIQAGLTAELHDVTNTRFARIRYPRDQVWTDAWAAVPAYADHLGSSRPVASGHSRQGLIETELKIPSRAYEVPEEMAAELDASTADHRLYFAAVGSIPVMTASNFGQNRRTKTVIIDLHPPSINTDAKRPGDVLRLLLLPPVPTAEHHLRDIAFTGKVERCIDSPQGLYFIRERKPNESGVPVWDGDASWYGMQLAQDEAGTWQAIRHDL